MVLEKTRQVDQHYDRWPFPGEDFPGQEGLLLVRLLRSCLREATAGGAAPPRIIDVGCGTGHTTLALARLFPEAVFCGVDVATASLSIARRTAKERGIPNVTFEEADLTRPVTEHGLFEVVLSLGVLHHIDRRRLAFEHLVQLMADGGHLFLWLYGRHGRHAHNLNQKFLGTLCSGLADPERFTVAEAFLSELGADFVLGAGFYTPEGAGEAGLAYLQKRPQWLADQMIPPFEEPFSLEDILELFQAFRLNFGKWLGAPNHLKKITSCALLLERFEKLSSREQMLAIDYLIKPEYYFVTGRKEPD
jgi:SAM-dependent methyltransferase